MHCLAAEEHETFLRVAVIESEGIKEVAYETVVLGRLRPGYRVLQLRNRFGTRIEHCFLFVKISRGQLAHTWASADDLRCEVSEMRRKLPIDPSTTCNHDPSPIRTHDSSPPQD